MKKLVALISVLAAATAMAAEFPYSATMTTLASSTNSLAGGDSVAIADSGTTGTNNLVSIYADAAAFTPADDWDSLTNSIENVSTAKAMLTVWEDDSTGSSVYKWMGYAGGAWVELSGVTFETNATYDVKIDFDGTVESGKVRYSVRKTSATEYTALVNSSNVSWLAYSWAEVSSVELAGDGSADSASIAAAVRPAVADITVAETYAFDYSNVVFAVTKGSECYGATGDAKVTLTDTSDSSKTYTVTAAFNDDGVATIDFSEQNLVPYSSYDCVISIGETAGKTETVTLATSADWFGFSAGELVKATQTGATIVSAALVPDDDTTAVVTPTLASPESARTTVEITVDYSDAFAEVGDTLDKDSQNMLALTESGWVCFDGGAKVALTCSNEDYEKAGVYTTKAYFDYAAGTVTFSVKSGEGAYVTLADSTGKTAFSVTGTKLSNVAFNGNGSITAIDASYAVAGAAVAAPAADGTITLTGSTDIDISGVTAGSTLNVTRTTSDAKTYSYKWSDNGGKYIVEENGTLKVVAGTPANGLSSYDSYALGLDATDAASKPLIDAVQDAETGKLTINLGNVSARSDIVEVTSEIQSSDSPNSGFTKAATVSEGKAEIELGSTVKYYRVNFTIKTK